MYNKSKSIRHGGERLFERLGPEDIQHGTDQFNYAIYRHDPKNYEYTFDTHWHEEYEIIYVKDGVFHYLIDGQEYCVKKGEALFLDQCAIHTFLEYPPPRGICQLFVWKKICIPCVVQLYLPAILCRNSASKSFPHPADYRGRRLASASPLAYTPARQLK